MYCLPLLAVAVILTVSNKPPLAILTEALDDFMIVPYIGVSLGSKYFSLTALQTFIVVILDMSFNLKFNTVRLVL